MNIKVNNRDYYSPEPTLTVAQLAEELGLPPSGMAIAVNNKVVRKTSWPTTMLAAGDAVTVITAVCGG